MPHQEIAQPFQRLSKYAHLRPADIEIWERFLLANPDRFLKVWYDYRVGDPADLDHECLFCANLAWYDLTRWQIDVVAEDREMIYVIEIKPHANAKAIGQALSYAKLFEVEQKPKKPVLPVVLTDVIIPTTQKCAAHCGVEIWQA